MSTFSPRPLLPTFLPSLNALLTTLALPFAIDDPTDLTPSLLLAIFESLINARLPIPSSVRKSRTRDAKSRAMLVLLGVLECDVLRGGTADAEHSIAMSNGDDSVLGGAGGVSVDGWVDEIGLGEVDPERLADGGWEETIFIGELLCWLARRKGILPRTGASHRFSHTRSLYSNHHSYGTDAGEGEGDMTDFSASLLLQPSPSQRARSPRPPSPSPSVDDVDAEPECSVLSHITDVPRHPLVHSPEPSISASATTGTDLSIRARSVSSRTSVSNVYDNPDDSEDVSQDTIQMYDARRMIQDAEEDDDRPPTFRPRCIHELDDPSYIQALAGPSSSFNSSTSHDHVSEGEDDPSRDYADEDSNDPYAPQTPTPQRVRLTGWIDHVDTTAELDHFTASRSHSGSWAFPGLGSGLRTRSPLHAYARTGEISASAPRPQIELSPPRRPSNSRTPRHASPSPPPSLPMPSPLPSTSSKHPSLRLPSNSPPSPSSPTSQSDPPFDVSFSTLNNTSTPAKPRLPPRRQFQTTTHPVGTETSTHTHVGVDRNKGRGGTALERGAGRPYSGYRDRSPPYIPSPPSFSTPASSRSGGASAGSGASGITITGTKTRLGGSAPSTTRKKGSMSPSSAYAKGKSPPPAVPAGSTVTTNVLLTERARLLTELAALKRVRAASGGGAAGMGVGTSGRGVVGHRVGVGV